MRAANGRRPRGGRPRIDPSLICLSISTDSYGTDKADLRNKEHAKKVLAKLEMIARGEPLPGSVDPFASDPPGWKQ